jgi:quercetin dioxygenase-like cupin family protein
VKFGSSSEVPAQDVSQLLPGTRGVYVQWLVSRADGSERVALRRFLVKPHAIMPYHKHKYAEAVFMLRGRLKVNINGVDRVLGPGDFFYTGPYEPHSIENPSDEEAEFICAISYEDDMTLQPVEQGP